MRTKLGCRRVRHPVSLFDQWPIEPPMSPEDEERYMDEESR